MSKMEPMLSPSQALKRYRRLSPPECLAQVRDFNKMGINDRIELLFFMVIHGAQQLKDVSEEVGVDHPILADQGERDH